MLRYGFLGRSPITLREGGEIMGVTTARFREHVNNGIRDLLKGLKKHRWSHLQSTTFLNADPSASVPLKPGR